MFEQMLKAAKAKLGISTVGHGMPPLSPYHMTRKVEMATANLQGTVAIVGDSHADRWALEDSYKMLPHPEQIMLMGVGEDLTNGVIDLLPFIVDKRPKTIILSIGSNNLGWETPEAIAAIGADITNIVAVMLRIPATVLIHPILPACKALVTEPIGARTPENLNKFNTFLASLAHVSGMPFINHYASLVVDYELRADCVVKDGFHLNPKGYLLWAELLRPYLL